MTIWERFFATDASIQKGAVCSRKIKKVAEEILWLGGDKRGSFAKLDSSFKAIRRALGEDVDEEVALAEENHLEVTLGEPQHALGFSFDFVEICGGSGVVSAAMAQKGYTVCTPIDIERSPHFDLEAPELVHWILYMIRTKRFRSIFLSPLCTTLSPAAHPCVRSYLQPFGFNRRCRKTRLGNI